MKNYVNRLSTVELNHVATGFAQHLFRDHKCGCWRENFDKEYDNHLTVTIAGQRYRAIVKAARYNEDIKHNTYPHIDVDDINTEDATEMVILVVYKHIEEKPEAVYAIPAKFLTRDDRFYHHDYNHHANSYNGEHNIRLKMNTYKKDFADLGFSKLLVNLKKAREMK